MPSLHALEALLADLSPWLRYLMVAICERHLQQADLRLICQTQLDPELERGDVPGREGWTYARKFGQEIMVTRSQGRVVWLDLDLSHTDEPIEQTGLLIEVLPAGPGLPEGSPTPAVERLRRWMPARDFVVSALEQLQTSGLIESLGNERLRLGAGPLEAISRFNDLQEDSEGYARLTAGTPDDESELAAWRAWVLELSEQLGSGALVRTHEDLEPEEVERIVTKFLTAPLGVPTIIALQVAGCRDMPIDASLVQGLVKQIAPTNEEGAAAATMAVAEYSLENDVERDDTIERLIRYGAEAEDLKFGIPEGESDEAIEEIWQFTEGMSLGIPGIDDAARLLLEYAPSRCLVTVRRALRDHGHANLVTAIRLVAIGQGWAIREVEAAVRHVPNPHIRHTIAALLSNSGHELAALRAREASADADTSDAMMFAMANADLEGMEVAFGNIAKQGLDGQAEWAAKFRERVGEDFEPEG